MKKTVSYLLISFLVILGCDFRLPQDWETPNWHLPLSVPLFNDSITLGDMINTGYTCSIEGQGFDPDSIYETLANCENLCFIEQNGVVEYQCKSIFSLEPNVNDSSFIYP